MKTKKIVEGKEKIDYGYKKALKDVAKEIDKVTCEGDDWFYVLKHRLKELSLKNSLKKE